MKLNIGCGLAMQDDCVNVDVRALPGAVVADARKLPFGSEVFEEVYALDVIEHMTAQDAETALSEISRVLTAEGKAFFQLPSLRGIVDEYLLGVSAEKVSWWLFGGQDYKENYHYVVYDESSFERALKRNGLAVVKFEQNGTNMNVEVKKWRE